MLTSPELPPPRLSQGRFSHISALTDEELFEAIDLRIAFTERGGGVSEGSFSSLNLGFHVGDEKKAVEKNIEILRDAFGIHDMPCLGVSQVHGSRVLNIENEKQATQIGAQIPSEEADAIIIAPRHICALLRFADCVPVIAASPSGHFALIHAGWRGTLARIVEKAIQDLHALDVRAGFNLEPNSYNVYLGPHIRQECFQVDVDLACRFKEEFGNLSANDNNCIDLAYALKASLLNVGIDGERIADTKICTVCENERYFSYRAQDGICGRHGAFAVRM